MVLFSDQSVAQADAISPSHQRVAELIGHDAIAWAARTLRRHQMLPQEISAVLVPMTRNSFAGTWSFTGSVTRRSSCSGGAGKLVVQPPRVPRPGPCTQDRNGLVLVGVRTDGVLSMEAMQVYHLTIQENGHSRRFVYEDRDEALTRLADATAAGLDAKLEEVVRAPALPKPTKRGAT